MDTLRPSPVAVDGGSQAGQSGSEVRANLYLDGGLRRGLRGWRGGRGNAARPVPLAVQPHKQARVPSGEAQASVRLDVGRGMEGWGVGGWGWRPRSNVAAPVPFPPAVEAGLDASGSRLQERAGFHERRGAMRWVLRGGLGRLGGRGRQRRWGCRCHCACSDQCCRAGRAPDGGDEGYKEHDSQVLHLVQTAELVYVTASIASTPSILI